MTLIDLAGKRFGRLVVVSRHSPPGTKHIHWNCVCDCGTEKTVNGDAIRNGLSKSCGCLRRDLGSWNSGKVGIESHSFKGIGIMPRSMYTEIKYKAGKRGLKFDLSEQYLVDLFHAQDGLCAISGLPIAFESGGRMPSDCASLDRRDCLRGYVEGNVQWVARRINFMKGRCTDEEFVELCKLVAIKNA